MITRISGTLENISEESVIIGLNGISYQVFIPGVLFKNINEYVKKNILTLYTKYYIEGGMHGGNQVPRLIGFGTETEREFFEKFTSVSGFGEKKALKALIIPFSTIASAIEASDKRTLMDLPGIGGRLADKIIAALKGKMVRFAEAAGLPDTKVISGSQDKVFLDAVSVLLQLDFNQREAETRVAEVFEQFPDLNNSEDVLTEVFRRQHSRK